MKTASTPFAASVRAALSRRATCQPLLQGNLASAHVLLKQGASLRSVFLSRTTKGVSKLLSVAVAALASLLVSMPARSAETCPSLLYHAFPRLTDARPQSLCEYRGKVVLVVNTASYCGFTKQYDGLEQLYARLKDRGFVVVGFPSNDFGEQEPGSNQEIADFCRLTYGVQFPMFAKTTLKGPNANPFFAELVKRSGTTPKWNFYKYLIDRSGREVVAYSSFTDPDDRKLLAKIDEFLARKP